MNRLKLVSPIPDSVNHYLSPKIIQKGGRPFVIMYESPSAKRYKKEFGQYVKSQVLKQKYTLVPDKYQHYYVDCVFYFDRIDRDANNYFKLLLDAITETGMIWVDDNTVCERVNAIYYDSENPRIEMEIYPTEYVGIFEDKTQMSDFVNNWCAHCRKYTNNCQLLAKAKIGKIQEDISPVECKKYKKRSKRK